MPASITDLFSPLARQFAARMQVWSASPSLGLEWASLLVCHFRSEGHTCFPLSEVANRFLDEIMERAPLGIRLPSLENWMDDLDRSGLVHQPFQEQNFVYSFPPSKSSKFLPLVLDASLRLYLHRYWIYELETAAILRARACERTKYEPDRLIPLFHKYFPNVESPECDWQAIAAFSALSRGLTVLSGGPGTGKTRTVAWHLGLLAEVTCPRRPRISLVAPTGKAASRLAESIRFAFQQLPPGLGVSNLQIDEATTVHRWLGYRPGSRSSMPPDAPSIVADVVVVDEASMLDLSLLVRLLRVLPISTRLVLVGDQQQLSSVEAGSILGEIWSGCWPGRYSPLWAKEVRDCTGQVIPPACLHSDTPPFADSLVELRQSHRFDGQTTLATFSRAIRNGALAAARTAWSGASPGIILRSTLNRSDVVNELAHRITDWHRRLLQCPDPAAAMAILGQYRFLTPLRQGPWGADSLQRSLISELHRRSVVEAAHPWYPGRPILVTSNSSDLGLSNGDTGVTWMDSSDNLLKVWFQGPNGQVRGISPLRLPAHETAYVMTVHKSQGSEFNEVVLILPDNAHPMIHRAMIYTAVTRARRHVEVWGREADLLSGLARVTERHSGLSQALWRFSDNRPPDNFQVSAPRHTT